MSIRVLFLPLILALASCATAPPAPSNPDFSGLAIRMKVRAPMRIFSQKPEQVMFLRLSGEGGSFTNGEIMPSNYERDGYLYLLNALPGTYVAVCCFKDMEAPAAGPVPAGLSVSFRPGSTNYTTYLPEDMIRETRVTVQPGQVAFMGDFVVDQNLGFEEADPTQSAYYARFGAGDAGESFLTNAFGGDYHYRGSMHECDRGTAVQADFAEAASSSLVEAGWKLSKPQP